LRTVGQLSHFLEEDLQGTEFPKRPIYIDECPITGFAAQTPSNCSSNTQNLKKTTTALQICSSTKVKLAHLEKRNSLIFIIHYNPPFFFETIIN
jgi:hypothetical protein